MSQSSGVPLAPVNQHQTPVALTKVGDGWLGYIGDVNNEMGSQDAIHAMIELGVNPAIYAMIELGVKHAASMEKA